MTKLGVATKSQGVERSVEVPSVVATAVRGEVDEEPPSSRTSSMRNRFFAHIPAKDWSDWKWQFRNRITTVEELAKYFPLSPEETARLRTVIIKYPLAVTPYYLSLIDSDDPGDPIRKQCIPCFEEVTMGSMGYEDPLEEQRESVVPGLVHRYPDRVLMVLTDICAMLCRHCTRKREWKNGGWVRDEAQVEEMLRYIRLHTEVRDVIISGGDPLTLSTRRLEAVLSALRKIPHVEIIRIGTRFPVVLPQRVDEELCSMLSKYGPIWLNTHFNHPREVTSEAVHACDRLLRAGVPVNNQSVLLKGINDNIKTMTDLCHRLLMAKVRPYYLFQCDEVQGTEHLRTPVESGVRIIAGMRGHTSGLAIPTFVVDLPHGGGKVSVQPDYIVSRGDGEIVFKNYEGRLIRYRNPGTAKTGSKRASRSGVLAGSTAGFESLDPAAWRPA